MEHINRLKPSFAIVCGDLTHAVPNAPKYVEQVRDCKEIVSRVDPEILLVCLCGNHDLGNRPNPGSIALYESNFGPHYYSFWIKGIFCICLNSTLIFDPQDAQEHYSAQEKWLDLELSKCPSTHTLIFTHHPWFLSSADESDSYFSIPLERRIPYLEKFKRAGCTACFAGHYHRNSLGRYQGMEMITTSAVGKPLGLDPSGFRIVKVYADKIEHEYYSLDGVPESIDLEQQVNSTQRPYHL